MLLPSVFRSGHLSVPVEDADYLPAVCFSCPYLYGKEFSVGEGIVYLSCGYPASPRGTGEPRPACQVEENW